MLFVSMNRCVGLSVMRLLISLARKRKAIGAGLERLNNTSSIKLLSPEPHCLFINARIFQTNKSVHWGAGAHEMVAAE